MKPNKPNIDVTVRFCPSGSVWMEAVKVPVGVRREHGERIYLNGRSALPVSNADRYPGYLEWLVTEIGNGRTQDLTVAEWRKLLAA